MYYQDSSEDALGNSLHKSCLIPAVTNAKETATTYYIWITLTTHLMFYSED